MKVKVNSSEQKTTAWKRYITFQYEGKDYEGELLWDSWEGYELIVPAFPEIDNYYDLMVLLDELSYELQTKEKVSK